MYGMYEREYQRMGEISIYYGCPNYLQIHPGQVIAVDGKTVRGSCDRAHGKAALHMVSAWASDNELILGQDHRCQYVRAQTHGARPAQT